MRSALVFIISSLLVPLLGHTALAFPVANPGGLAEQHGFNAGYIKSNLRKDAKIIQQGAKKGDLKAVCTGLACGARDAARYTGEKAAQLGRKVVGDGRMTPKKSQQALERQKGFIAQGSRRKATLKSLQKRMLEAR